MSPAVETKPLDVVAIVGSAGGIEAMEAVLGGLPTDLNAAVVVVLHLMPEHPSLLARILGRKTALPVREAIDGDALEPGVVYVAPPDDHLVVAAGGTLHLERSERVHHVRPSADALLLSIAKEYRGRCLAIVLSGTGSDGAAGAAAVHEAGGRVLAQDEATAQHFGMPGAAILAGGVDAILSLDEIGPAVVDFAGHMP
ncbi:MAG: chemotaxis protein CheB [Actinobacteria bacterium]|nr:chemotaxis protein CheB [Actinomycetota bacterium]MBV8479088.1 chemotaxis protein CheB [Actinomycetota bacterium]MBV8597942.1 chemotaxis protein CheB [Actinomycetota bacterium]